MRPSLDTPTTESARTVAPAPAIERSGSALLPSAILTFALIALAIGVRARIISPGALARLPRREVSIHPAHIWFGAGLGTVFFAAVVAALAQLLVGQPIPPGEAAGAGGAGGAAGTRGGDATHLQALVLPSIISYAATILACLAFARLVLARGGGLRGLTGPPADAARWPWLVLFPRGASAADTARAVLAGGAWFAAIMPIVLTVAMLAAWTHERFVGTPPDALAHESLKLMIEHRASAWTWGFIFGAVMGAPIVEEHVYRCFLQSGVIRAGLSPALSIVIVSVVFALTHVNAAPVHALAPLFVLSLGMGLAYERTGRLLVPVTMHALFNAANVAMAFVV
ncbi:MAG: lysostaphin resistance A-like protein [Phycisphaerales bacterium]